MYYYFLPRTYPTNPTATLMWMCGWKWMIKPWTLRSPYLILMRSIFTFPSYLISFVLERSQHYCSVPARYEPIEVRAHQGVTFRSCSKIGIHEITRVQNRCQSGFFVQIEQNRSIFMEMAVISVKTLVTAFSVNAAISWHSIPLQVSRRNLARFCSNGP